LSQYLQKRVTIPIKEKEKITQHYKEVQVHLCNNKKRGIAHKPARKQTSGSVVSSNPEHTAVSTAFFPSLPKWKVNMLT
jgi:hypothetical protein